MTYDQQEKFLQDKLSEFVQQMKEAAEKVISDVEVTYLPHVLSDTECNAAFQAEECIKEILRGNFKKYRAGVIANGMYVGITNYNDLATAIYNKAKDKVENAAIKELQSKVAELEGQLRQAYNVYI